MAGATYHSPPCRAFPPPPPPAAAQPPPPPPPTNASLPTAPPPPPSPPHPPQASSYPPAPRLPRQASLHGDAPLPVHHPRDRSGTVGRTLSHRAEAVPITLGDPAPAGRWAGGFRLVDLRAVRQLVPAPL